MSQPRVTVTFGRGNRQVFSRIGPEALTAGGRGRGRGRGRMYSDRIIASARRRRDLRLRLGPARDNGIRKRVRAEDDKWEHDLYQDGEDRMLTGPAAQKEDLRSRLSGGGANSNSQAAKPAMTPTRQLTLMGNQANGGLASGDLRRKLMRTSQSPMVTPAGVQRLSSVVQETLPSRTPTVRTVRTVTMQTTPPSQEGTQRSTFIGATSTGRQLTVREQGGSQQPFYRPGAVGSNQEGGVINGHRGRAVAAFLQSLGLSKYIPSFQAEEVDMAALRHMTEEDFKELNVPMGPRKKIMLALKQ